MRFYNLTPAHLSLYLAEKTLILPAPFPHTIEEAGRGDAVTKFKRKGLKVRVQPIEEHSTAAWANIDREEGIAKVPIPSQDFVKLARDWVNHNQK
jgi:hypothetical protein